MELHHSTEEKFIDLVWRNRLNSDKEGNHPPYPIPDGLLKSLEELEEDCQILLPLNCLETKESSLPGTLLPLTMKQIDNI